MSKRVPEPSPADGVIQRTWALLLPRRDPITVTATAPQKLIIRCVLGGLKLDLTKAEFPRGADRVTMDITMLGGRLEIAVPHDWALRAGRLSLARGTAFSGTVGAAEQASDMVLGDDPDRLVVLNVQGWRGTVMVIQAEPPDPDSLGVGPGAG